MKENKTHITFVLDSSGSMDPIKKDTIGGFNSFLKGQKETAKEHDTFSFVTFSSNYGLEVVPYNFVYKNAKIKDVPDLNSKTYRPNGGTALLDTLGDTIKDLGAYFASLNEEDRPSKVVFVILTDGEENASRKFNKTQINNLITEHTGTWKWEFVFLGANQNAIHEAASYGISQHNAMDFGTSKAEFDSTYNILTRSLNTYKSSAVGLNYAESGAAFTAEERIAAKSPGSLTTPADLSVGTFCGTANIALGQNPFYVGPVIPVQSTSKVEIVKDDGHEVTVKTGS
jgi:hypothetical protein